MNRKNIDELISLLIAIKYFAKDIHYNCSGPDFYGNHLLADRIGKNLDDYIDKLIEICLLGHNFKPLPFWKYLENAILTKLSDFVLINRMMGEVLNLIEKINNISKADENILSEIAQDIQNNKALINIMFNEVE